MTSLIWFSNNLKVLPLKCDRFSYLYQLFLCQSQFWAFVRWISLLSIFFGFLLESHAHQLNKITRVHIKTWILHSVLTIPGNFSVNLKHKWQDWIQWQPCFAYIPNRTIGQAGTRTHTHTHINATHTWLCTLCNLISSWSRFSRLSLSSAIVWCSFCAFSKLKHQNTKMGSN